MRPLEEASSAAEAIRALTHQTRSRTAVLDVTDVYQLLAELSLMTGRLPLIVQHLAGLARKQELLDAGEWAPTVRAIEDLFTAITGPPPRRYR